MGDFDWKVWLKKLAKGLGLTIGATACIYIAEFLSSEPLPEEYAFWGGLLIIVLQQIGNWIKHNYLVE